MKLKEINVNRTIKEDTEITAYQKFRKKKLVFLCVTVWTLWDIEFWNGMIFDLKAYFFHLGKKCLSSKDCFVCTVLFRGYIFIIFYETQIKYMDILRTNNLKIFPLSGRLGLTWTLAKLPLNLHSYYLKRKAFFFRIL